MVIFRFAIMGAGNIAHTFVDAIDLMPGIAVVAVASRSADKASSFALRHNIPQSFDQYARMLEKVRPDAVYIATLPASHYALTRLCLEHRVPVLCEKAMFTCARQAEEAFALSKANNTFAMEAMWSRFLPVHQQARFWLEQGRIGVPKDLQITIGAVYDPVTQAGLLDPALGGGAANHLLVYGVELATLYFGQDIRYVTAAVDRDTSGVDVAEHVAFQYEDKMASLFCSCRAAVEERLVLSGTEGRIVMAHPHCTAEAFLYDADGTLAEHYTDSQTKNGFVYEIQEVVDCVNAGVIESDVVPHRDTLQCAHIFDIIHFTAKDR